MDGLNINQNTNPVKPRKASAFDRKKEILVLLALVLGFFFSMEAQVSITGAVKTQDNQSVPFANVLLLHPKDSSLVLGTITDEMGAFILEAQPGTYRIEVSLIGYQFIDRWINVDPSEEFLPLGEFHLLEDVQELNEVVVKGQKPVFVKQIDRTVVNVQSSMIGSGNSALDVLEKSPGVVVNRQSNSIALNGKTGVLIMINNKVTRLPMDAVVQMLDGMSAANIEKVELITSPPARYDAEGDAGIIHIVMIERSDMGINGNIGATLGYNRAETLGTSFNLNQRSKQLNSFLNYSVLHDRNQHHWINERYRPDGQFTRSNISNSLRDPVTTVQNLQAGFEYTLTDKTTANLLLSGYRRKWDLHASTGNVNKLAADSTYYTNMTLAEINRWQSASGSLGLNHRLNDRQEISLSFDYLYYHNNNPSDYQNQSRYNQSHLTETAVIEVEKLTPINFRVLNLDYSNRINDQWSINAGVKGTMSHFTNDVRVRRLVQGEMITDPELTSSSNLDEEILAAYGSWQWQPREQWSVQGGLRYEFTNTYLSTPEESGLVDRKFGNLFPSLFITRRLGENQSILLAYSRRITRPTFNDMAPFVFFIGPSSFVAGNLALRPAVSDGAELSYQLRRWWVSFKYSYTKDDIAFLQPEISPGSEDQIFRSQNLKYMKTMGINLTFPMTITPWWEMQNDASIHLHQYESRHLIQNVSRTIKSFTVNTTSTFKLPQDLSVELSGYYQSASVWGISQFKPIGRINLGIRKELRNEARITLMVNDLLNTSIWKLETEVESVAERTYMEYDWGNRAISLTFNQNFGNRKLKTVEIQSGSESERSRVQ